MWFGIVMGLSASASWAAANVFIQRSSRVLGPFRALVWAQVVGGLLLAPVAIALDHRTAPVDASLGGWIAVAALAAVLAYACMFYSMERGRLSIVVPVMSSWSVISAAVSLAVLHQAVRPAQLAGAALVVLGVLIVSRYAQGTPDANAGAGDATAADAARARRALLAAAGAAVGFGVLIPAMDRLAPAWGRLGAIPVVFGADLVLGLPLALVARVNLRPPPRAAWAVVAAAGLFEMLGFVWISLGVARAPVAIVSPLAGLASAFTVLYAWVVLGERPPTPVLFGAAAVCAGVVTLAV